MAVGAGHRPRGSTRSRPHGSCYMHFTRRKALKALKALIDGVPACTHCHPDTALGFLD
ncbi:DUF6233 domain-containing protein [Streptomyces sp. NBC_00191]|uniref:DUF6233 domain-containing protein n=1 Tax=Streptomyces sp. NBC_00191 TaxID=2975674 RepID=UPI00386D1CE4